MSFNSSISDNLPPLAQRIRPNTLNEFIGQKKILHKNSLIFLVGTGAGLSIASCLIRL